MSWRDIQSRLLEDEIEGLINSLPDTNSFRCLVRKPLNTKGRSLRDEEARCAIWHLLPLVVCEAICGTYKHALPAAAALRILAAAADVFDDIEDGDSSESLPARYGLPISTNIATTLVILAEKATMRLGEKGVNSATIVRVTDLINSCYLTACAGQHLDLSQHFKSVFSEDDYLRMVEMKTASQVECYCLTGAVLADASNQLINSFSSFGRNLGMATQIANDIYGILNTNDIVECKVTLPLIYALTQTNSSIRKQLEVAVFKNKLNRKPQQISELLFQSGAVQYATIKMETYKQQAHDTLPAIERAGATVERLRQFLELI